MRIRKLSLKMKILLVFLGLVVFSGLYIFFENSKIVTRSLVIESDSLPSGFSGYKIAHVSDLHNKNWGEKLLQPLREAGPDVIFITGDLIDSRKTDFDVAFGFVREAVEIAPTYYVPGNHEARFSNYKEILDRIEELGAVVLENKSIVLERSGDKILLLGLSDPTGIERLYRGESDSSKFSRILGPLVEGFQGYKVLLSHRPELFPTYADFSIDLTFSGHAHGGQVVLPFVGPLLAPNQGYFPKITDGLYKDGTSNLVVSRGLGNSVVPIRINDPFDLIFVELEKSGEFD